VYCIIPRSTVFPLLASLLTSRHTMVYSSPFIPTITSQPMSWVSAAVAPPSQTTASGLTASNYSSNLARSWPPIASPNSLDHSHQVHLQTRLITASKSNYNLAQSRPPSSHDHGLQVHLETRSIAPSKCISNLDQLRSPTVYDDGLQTRRITASKFTWSQPPNSHNHDLRVHR